MITNKINQWKKCHCGGAWTSVSRVLTVHLAHAAIPYFESRCINTLDMECHVRYTRYLRVCPPHADTWGPHGERKVGEGLGPSVLGRACSESERVRPVQPSDATKNGRPLPRLESPAPRRVSSLVRVTINVESISHPPIHLFTRTPTGYRNRT